MPRVSVNSMTLENHVSSAPFPRQIKLNPDSGLTRGPVHLSWLQSCSLGEGALVLTSPAMLFASAVLLCPGQPRPC